MYVLVTYKNKKDQMKNEHAGVVKTIQFISDAQEQLTLSLVVSCGRKSNSFKLLCLSLLPARMRKIHSKIKGLEWSQQIFHCKYIQIFPDAQGQLTPQYEFGSA